MCGSVACARATTTKAAAGRPNWRIVRYADGFVVLTDGKRDDVEALREDIADVLQPLGLRHSEAKTQVVHMSDGFDFLGTRARLRLRPGHPHDAEKPAPGAASADGGLKVFPGLHRRLVAEGVGNHETPVTVAPESVLWTANGAPVESGVLTAPAPPGASHHQGRCACA
jgi:hypothetical protein